MSKLYDSCCCCTTATWYSGRHVDNLQTHFFRKVRLASLFKDVTHATNVMQIASCAKCSYQYELVSGNIDSIASEEIGLDYLSAFVSRI